MKPLMISAIALASMSGLAVAQTSPSTAPATNPPTMSTPHGSTAPHAATPGKTDNNLSKSTMNPAANPGGSSGSATNSTTGMSGSNAMADHGMKTGSKTPSTPRYVSVDKTDLMTSKLIGVDVYNSKDNSIGEIKDFVVKDGKAISGVVVSVGGFLGMGEHYVVLDPSAVALRKDKDTWKAYVNTTKEALKNAPEFKYPSEQG